MIPDETILRRALTEPLPEPKEIPPFTLGISGMQHWSPPTARERVESIIQSGWGWVTLFRGGPVVPPSEP